VGGNDNRRTITLDSRKNKAMTNKEAKQLQEAINLRTIKIMAYQKSIDKLKRNNLDDLQQLEKHWEQKYSKKK
jgi:hypothetical protein